jgi:ketosteroid isomerase-like protein
MKVLLPIALLIAVAIPLVADDPQTAKPNPDQTREELTRISQELLDAVAPGNKAPWERHLAPEFVMMDENGKVLTKAQILEEFGPLPKGFSGNIKVTEPQVRQHGDVAVLVHRDIENEEIFGQKITATYVTTETYLRRDGRWQLIASHVAILPSELKPVKADSKTFDAFVGTYELGPEVTYTVTREGNKLFGQRGQRSKEELLPAGTDTFFVPGRPRGVKIFARGADGKVTEIVDRRDNNDLIWKRK